eukprot:49432-Chlamydomonas_euryale.AAC.1
MAADVPWPRAVPRVIIDPAWLVAAGDDSTEAAAMAERAERLPRVSYPTPSHVPPSPAEPASGEPEPDERAAPPLRVPLNVAGAGAGAAGAPLPDAAAAPAAL